MKVTVLGCGASWGVPPIGGGWGACDPANPKNARRRCSVLVEGGGGGAILVDASPDLRAQLLDAGVRRLDAVVFTHAHADHLHGIDDLRGINMLMRRAIPAYATADTLAQIGQRFGYVFAPLPDGKSYYFKPVLTPVAIAGPFEAGGIGVTPFAQRHGTWSTLGLRFGRFAYSTDVSELDDAAFAALAGVEIWVVDCLRRAPHPTHSHLERTLAWIDRVRPRRAVLTHMDESLDYASLRRMLPPGVEPGFDGMILEV